MSFEDLPVLGSHTGAPAKPAKGADRQQRKLDCDKRGKAFRDAVWARVRALSPDGYAYCERCQRGPLIRTLDVLSPLAGHVAHQRGRRVAPADKFNPEKAQLLCSTCHLASHYQRFAR